MEKSTKELTKDEYLEILKELSENIENANKKEPVNNQHDKTFKIVLENKEEVANLINKVMEFEEKIEPEELERYNKNFITENLKIQEADMVYKLKNKKVFILIEHQTKVDYSMAYRILNYQIEIMRNCIEEKKLKNKSYEHALVIAMVLHTGPRRWTAKRHIQGIQTKTNLNTITPILENYYYIADINDYTKEELLEEKSFLSKIMILEKSKSKEELLKNFYEIIPRTAEENRGTLSRLIKYAYKNYFNEETIKDIINKIEAEGGENMLASVEMLEKERKKDIKKGMKIGRAEGIKFGEARGVKTGIQKEKLNLAKRMLKEKFSIEIIEKITGLKREKFM